MTALPPSRSPVFARAKAIASEAAQLYLREGVDPSEAIVKAGGDELNLSRSFRDLVTSQCNHFIFKDLRQTDKLAEYPVALADKVEAVMGNMQKAASEQVVSPVWDRGTPRTAWFEKVATRTQRGVDVNNFGIPVDLKEPTYNMSQIAEQKLAADYWTTQEAARLEKQAEYELERLYSGTKIAVKDFIRKEAAKGQHAFPVAFNLAALCAEEHKTAAALFVSRCMSEILAEGGISKTAAEKYEGEYKAAALDFLDSGVPVSRGVENIVVQLNTMIDAASDKPKEPRFAGPGDYAPAGAYDKIKFKAEGIFRQPTGGANLVARDATSMAGRRIF